MLHLNRQTDQPEGVSDQSEETGSRAVPDEQDDHFWGLDDIPGSYWMFVR